MGFVFSVPPGASAPAPQTLTVSNAGGGTLTFAFAATTSSGGNWLAVNPASGSVSSSPASVQIAVNTGTLAEGVYRGKITGTFSRGVTQEIEVVLLVSSTVNPAGASERAVCTPQGLELIATTVGNGVSVPVSDGVVEGAGFTPRRPLAPGSIVSLFGERLAGGIAAADRVPLTTELSGVSVRIGGQSVPLYFVSGGQINAQVPYEIAGQESVSVLVSSNGMLTAPQSYFVAPAQPAIFMAGANAAILDSQFRLITPQNPARIGDTLQIFAAGLGAVDPQVLSGSSTAGLTTVRTPVTVLIGDRQASIAYQGLAPNFVGLYQVNVVVPGSVAPGDAVSIVLRQNGVNSNPEQNITIPVRSR